MSQTDSFIISTVPMEGHVDVLIPRAKFFADTARKSAQLSQLIFLAGQKGYDCVSLSTDFANELYKYMNDILNGFINND